MRKKSILFGFSETNPQQITHKCSRCSAISIATTTTVGGRKTGKHIESRKQTFCRHSMHVFDRLGRWIFSHLLDILPGIVLTCTDGHFWLASYLGWLAAPLTQLLSGSVACFSEGRQSWPGGLVSLAWWLGLFLFWVSSNFELAILLVTRQGLDAVQRLEQKKSQS